MTHFSRLLDALASPGAAQRVRSLDSGGILEKAIPELGEGRAFAQPELHHYDVFEHNVAAVQALDSALYGPDSGELRQALAPADVDRVLSRRVDDLPLVMLTRLACLVHDIGKPRTATQLDGRLRFPRHGSVGATMLEARLPEAGLPEEATDLVCRLVRQHLRPAELVRNRPPTERAVRRFAASVNGHVIPLMLLNLSDGWATRGPGYTRDNFRRHCSFAAYVLELCAGVDPGSGVSPSDVQGRSDSVDRPEGLT